VKIYRAIILLTTMLIAMHGAGLFNTYHNLTQHASDSHSHACTTESTTENQAPAAPDEDREDTDCDLCLTLHTITPTLQDPTQLPALNQTRTLTWDCLDQAIPTTLHLSDRPARAPPLS